MRIRWLATVVCLGIGVAAAQAVITALTPLQNFLNDSTFIFVARVDAFFADKPAMVLVVDEDLKGKAPFRRLAVNLKVEEVKGEEKHQAEIVQRLGPDLAVILFVNQRGKRLITYAFSNGTWFHLLGQRTGDDTYAWSLVNGEPYLRRTFKGTTAEMKAILVDAIAGKAKPPAVNDKEEPGFGPPYAKKTSRHGGDALDHPGRLAMGRGLFAVIPTVGLGAPLAILAILFPTVFGGVLILFRQWIAFITLLGVNSTLLLLHLMLGGSFRGGWLGEPALLFLVMTGVNLLCFLWAWRRQVFNVSLGPAAIETPERTENNVLAIFSLILAAGVGLMLWLSGGQVDLGLQLFLVLAIGVWLATLMKTVRRLRGARSFNVPLSTEGLMVGGALVASLALIVSGSAEVTATTYEGDAGGDVVVKFDGKETWRYVTKESGVFVSTPLVDGDRVYAASAHPTFKFGVLHAIDRRTGKRVWEFDDDGEMKQVYSSPAAADGRLFIGEGFHDDPNCKLYCVAAETGKKLWHFETRGQTESSPAVALGRVYFGAGNSGFYCLDADKGKELWRYPPADYRGRLLRFCGNPLVVQGRVYIGTGVDRNQPKDKGETAVLCLDARSGALLWKKEVPLPCWAAPVIEGERLYVALGNGDIVADASFYDPAARNAGAIWCLEAESGKVLWKKEVSNGVINEVVLDEKHVYFGSRSGECICLAKKDGAEVWKREVGGAMVGAPALARMAGRTESVLAVGAFGFWASLDPATGKVQWANQIDGQCHFTASPRLVPTRAGRQIFIAGGVGGDLTNGKATLYCLEDRVTEK